MTEAGRLPIWRSLLYVPANNERFLGKALQRGADALVLDLEDGVPPDEKQTTRQALPETVDRLAGRGSDILVRVNAPLRLAVRDLEVAVRSGVRAVFLPKVESQGHLQCLAGVVDEVEEERGLQPGSLGLVPMIESSAALQRTEEIAGASARNVAILLGGEDIAAEGGFDPSPETLHAPKLRVLHAAKAAGILALGLMDSVAAIEGADDKAELARRSARFGFDGSTCVHPAMVGVLNKAFSPPPEVVEHARKVVAAMEAAWAEGKGAVRVDGRMVDVPVYQRARKVLERDRAIRALEQQAHQS